jgi:hypothetical protein
MVFGGLVFSSTLLRAVALSVGGINAVGIFFIFIFIFLDLAMGSVPGVDGTVCMLSTKVQSATLVD